MPVKKHTVIFIVGPTAAGKSAVAAFLARRIKGEVISCDSMQVYKLAPVLTQAPGVKETAKAPHHLINFLDAAKNYSAAEFSRRAKSLINDIIRRGRTPIVAGGSGLYVKALVDGLFASPAADEKFRKKMYGLVRRRGSRYLHDRLKESDPAQAALIHPNDARRIVRALEVENSTGRTMTELKKKTKGISAKYNIKMYGLTTDRRALYSSINARVGRMLKAGALDEAKRLKDRKLSRTAGAMIGLKELSKFLDGRCGLAEAEELMKRNTRRFAKRQLAWFRADKRITWFDIGKLSKSEIVKEIASALPPSQSTRDDSMLRRTSRASQ